MMRALHFRAPAFVTLSVLIIAIVIISSNVCCAKRHSKEVDITAYREKVKRMFYHAYEGYLKYAYPYDELKPLTCQGHDTWGSYSLTLIDAMDTLAVMGNYSEFRRIANLVIDKGENAFDMDINVSVFETNIRIVGGLISAHLLMKRAGMELEEAWPCSGPLLRMADNVARKLLPAFDTPTGMPYGTVSLRNGVPKGETSVTCTAGVGTFMIEFGTLSRLTGDPIFEKTAVRAIRSLWKHRSQLGLLGNHIDVKTGKWTALDAGIGGGVDSYFEYLVKGSVLFNLPELLHLFREYEHSIKQYLKKDDWYMWAQMTKGTITLPMFTSLDAFWPSIQMMLGDVDAAMKTLHNFHMVWRQFGFTPEYYNIPKSEAHKGREAYPLRPELIESIMYLYRATKDPVLLQMGVDIYESIERQARTSCGYATVKDVRDHRLEDRMESFFLAETTKYLYLLFDQENFIHNNGSKGQVINTPSGSCVIEAGGYVFNTEAHPIDLAAVHCCSAKKLEEDKLLEEFHSNLDLLSLLNLVEDEDEFGMTDWRRKKKKSYKSDGGLFKTNKDADVDDDNNVFYEDDTRQKKLDKVDVGGEGKEKIKGEVDQIPSQHLKGLRTDIGINLEASLPSGPSMSGDQNEKTGTKILTMNLPSMEKKIAKIFMETLGVDTNDDAVLKVVEKLRSKFKATKYEEIARRLAQQLLEENDKNMESKATGVESESDDDNDDAETDEVVEHSSENGEFLIDFLSELKDMISEVENDSNETISMVIEQRSKVNVDEFVDENGDKDNQIEGEGQASGEEVKSTNKENVENGEDQITNPAAEKLRHHLETQIKEEEEKHVLNKPSSDLEDVSGLESRRENILSLTKKVLTLFTSLSSGKVEILGEKGGGGGGGDISVEETESPSIGNLYANLAKHSLKYFDDPNSLHCPAQPFHSRLTVYGEFLVDE